MLALAVAFARSQTICFYEIDATQCPALSDVRISAGEPLKLRDPADPDVDIHTFADLRALSFDALTNARFNLSVTGH
jgi:hypothetical protein